MLSFPLASRILTNGKNATLKLRRATLDEGRIKTRPHKVLQGFQI